MHVHVDTCNCMAIYYALEIEFVVMHKVVECVRNSTLQQSGVHFRLAMH